MKPCGGGLYKADQSVHSQLIGIVIAISFSDYNVLCHLTMMFIISLRVISKQTIKWLCNPYANNTENVCVIFSVVNLPEKDKTKISLFVSYLSLYFYIIFRLQVTSFLHYHNCTLLNLKRLYCRNILNHQH